MEPPVETLSEIMEREDSMANINDMQTQLHSRLSYANQANSQVKQNMQDMETKQRTMDALMEKLASGDLTEVGRRAIERRVRTMSKMATDQQALETRRHKETALLEIGSPDSPTGVAMEMMMGKQTQTLLAVICKCAGIEGTEERMTGGSPEAQKCWLKVAEGMNRIGMLVTDPTGSCCEPRG